MICPNCGKETETGLFCENCGADLRGADNAPAEEPVNGFEEAAEAEPPKKKAGGFFSTPAGSEKWPLIISILLIAGAAIGILAKIDAIVGVAISRTKFFAIGNRFEFYWSLLLFPAVGAVLFFLKTRKKPYLTAIPFAVFGVLALNSCLKNLANFLANLGEGYTAGSYFAMFLHVLILLLIACCGAAFVAGMMIKKPGKLPLFAVIYGAAALLSVLLTMVLDIRYFILAIADSYPARTWITNVIYNFFTWGGALVVHAGCVFALINKAKDDKAEAEASDEEDLEDEYLPDEEE